MSTQRLLELSGVGFAYSGSGDRRASVGYVIGSIDLALRPGERVAIMGPSGCGKTTLLRIILGLLQQTTGSAVLPKRTDCSVVFQRPTLLPWRTAVQNVALPLELRGGALRRGATQSARHFIGQVGLAEFADVRPHKLSVGMQHRVALARALVVQPALVLLDEPFANLDLRLKREMNQLVAERLETAAGLLVTHDVDDALGFADRVLVLSPRPSSVRYCHSFVAPRGMRQGSEEAKTVRDEAVAALLSDLPTTPLAQVGKEG